MQELSIGYHTVFKKLRRSKTAMAGLVVIGLSVIIAVFAYVIAPDHTPDADLQTVEIQSMRPGYVQQFLKIPLQTVKKRNSFSAFFFGKPATHDFIPIRSYSIAGDSVRINKYVDEDTTVPQSYLITAITNGHPENIRQQVVSKKYLLGTDAFGRDILSRLVIGTRVSLAVGFIAVIISLLIGIPLGAFAGYYRGKTDAVIMWFINVTWSIPALLLVFALTLALGKGFMQIFAAVGLTLWVNVARLVRGQVLAVKEQEYIQAAKALGLRDRRIIFRHILPNIIGPVMVVAAGNFATAIIIEAGLSFLGVGVQPPQPSWGLMIRENYNLIITHNAVQALIPGFAIMLLVLAFNLVGNGLRDAADIRE